jgi:hypothetical protein
VRVFRFDELRVESGQCGGSAQTPEPPPTSEPGISEGDEGDEGDEGNEGNEGGTLVSSETGSEPTLSQSVAPGTPEGEEEASYDDAVVESFEDPLDTRRQSSGGGVAAAAVVDEESGSGGDEGNEGNEGDEGNEGNEGK